MHKIFTQPQKELSGARKIRRRLTESNRCAREWLLTVDRGEHVDCREQALEARVARASKVETRGKLLE